MECSICYTNINDDQLNTLSCNHYFHDSCVTNWINTQINSEITPSCPICRCNTITDIVFDNTYSDLPALIPITMELIQYFVDQYAYILNKYYMGEDINIDDILNILRYKSDFIDYISASDNIQTPTIFDHELESYNIAKNKSNLALLNWWMNKADTYTQNYEFNERNDCLKVASLIAAHYALI